MPSGGVKSMREVNRLDDMNVNSLNILTELYRVQNHFRYKYKIKEIKEEYK